MQASHIGRRKYQLEESPFYKKWSKPKLAQLLGIKSLKAFETIGSVDDYTIKPQPNNPEKTITTPKYPLKTIQKRIKILLSRIETPDYLFSGVKGRSYIDNAIAHANGNYVLTIDISKFYESCDIEKIFRFWKYRLKLPDNLAWRMSHLCAFDRHIPRGSPHSQLIAFWAYKELFDQINEIAINRGCYFSLYVDDMAFSSNNPISKEIIRDINFALKNHGLKINRKKTKSYSKKHPKLITGCIIKEGNIYTPNKRTKEVVDTIRTIRKTQNPEQSLLESLRGKITSIRQIERDKFTNFLQEI